MVKHHLYLISSFKPTLLTQVHTSDQQSNRRLFIFCVCVRDRAVISAKWQSDIAESVISTEIYNESNKAWKEVAEIIATSGNNVLYIKYIYYIFIQQYYYYNIIYDSVSLSV